MKSTSSHSQQRLLRGEVLSFTQKNAQGQAFFLNDQGMKSQGQAFFLSDQGMKSHGWAFMVVDYTHDR